MDGENLVPQMFETSVEKCVETPDWIESLEECTRRTEEFKERLVEKLSIQSEKWRNFVAVPLPVSRTHKRLSSVRSQRASLLKPPQAKVSNTQTSMTTSLNFKPMEFEDACKTPPNRIKLFAQSDAAHNPVLSDQPTADETLHYGHEDWDFPDEFRDGPLERLSRSILVKALGAEAQI